MVTVRGKVALELIDRVIDSAIRDAQFSRNGMMWTRQGDGFVLGVDVQAGKSASSTFTVNYGAVVDGETAYLVGQDLTATYVSGSTRIGSPSDRWWKATPKGIIAGSFYGPWTPVDDADLGDLILHRVIPNLNRLTSLDAILEESRLEGNRGRTEAIEAAALWQKAGRPSERVDVRAVDKGRFRLEVSEELAKDRPDLARHVVMRAAPWDLPARPMITEIALPVVQFDCLSAEADVIEKRCQNWLSLHRFGPAIGE